MKNNLIRIGVTALAFSLLPSLAPAVEVYKWVDENGILNLTDDPKRIPEKFKSRVETVSVPDKYEEPSKVPEKVLPPAAGPEKPKAVPAPPEKPPSKFIPFDQFKYITEGMSEAEVLSRFGPPSVVTADEVRTRGRSRVLVKRYYYLGDFDLGERPTILHINNGVVQKIERIFPPTW